MGKFVSSCDIPDALAEAIALAEHRRGCGGFNGRKSYGPPKFEGQHKATDMTWASIHTAVLCQVLDIQPEVLEAIRTRPTVDELRAASVDMDLDTNEPEDRQDHENGDQDGEPTGPLESHGVGPTQGARISCLNPR